jgi:hypothetical protein
LDNSDLDAAGYFSGVYYFDVSSLAAGSDFLSYFLSASITDFDSEFCDFTSLTIGFVSDFKDFESVAAGLVSDF